MPYDTKQVLQRYLQRTREALVWKLDGLSEYDKRRPMTPTGTNLLGIVKHVAMMEAGYLGDVFDRPFAGPPSWVDDLSEDAEANADMWARPDEASADIVASYREVWAHSDATITQLPLDAIGRVPWWPPEHAELTLLQAAVHMIDESARHAGQADVVRELIDGAAGIRADNSNLPEVDAAWWVDYRERLERAAQEAGAASS